MTDSAAVKRWTTRDLLRWIGGYFAERGVDSPRVCAELLVSHVLGCERMRLYMESDRPASSEELARLRELVARGARHEPVQYLVGHTWFFTHRFEVGPATLIPRPSTETLVEHVLQHLRAAGTPDPRLLDLGTGTGCIAVSLARSLPAARVTATDIEPEALVLAARNAAAHAVDERIEFRAGDLWSALSPEQPTTAGGPGFDAIVSNPPYISDAEWAEVPPNVRDHEPARALRGGADGLDLVRPVIAGAPAWLRPGGLFAVEIAASQGSSAMALATEANPPLEGIRVLKDHEGLDRVLVAVRP